MFAHTAESMGICGSIPGLCPISSKGKYCRGIPDRRAGSAGRTISSFQCDKASQNKMLAAIQVKYGSQVRYRGRPLNKSMLAAALAVSNVFPADGKGLKLLKLIGQWYEKCLGAYSTPYKFCNAVSTFLKDTPDGSLSAEDRIFKFKTTRIV